LTSKLGEKGKGEFSLRNILNYWNDSEATKLYPLKDNFSKEFFKVVASLEHLDFFAARQGARSKTDHKTSTMQSS
jgi:hypothetical protein